MHPASLTAMRPSRASSDDIGAMRPRGPAPRPSAPTASGPARASCHRRSEMGKFWLAQGTRLRSGKRTGCAWRSIPAQRRQARKVGIRCRLRRIRPCRCLRRWRLRTQNTRRSGGALAGVRAWRVAGVPERSPQAPTAPGSLALGQPSPLACGNGDVQSWSQPDRVAEGRTAWQAAVMRLRATPDAAGWLGRAAQRA